MHPCLGIILEVRSHMLQIEKGQWVHLMAETKAEDLWLTLEHAMPSYTYHHNALHNYWARLDGWYIFNAQQFADFTIKLTLDHSLPLSDHAPLWMALNFGMPKIGRAHV